MAIDIRTFKYIVADPLVCHGKWTFKGTRIFVSDVLDQLESGMPHDEIVKDWRGDVTLNVIIFVGTSAILLVLLYSYFAQASRASQAEKPITSHLPRSNGLKRMAFIRAQARSSGAT